MRSRILSTCTLAALASAALPSIVAAQQTASRPVQATAFPTDVEKALALSGAPEHLRGGAAVYVYGAKGFTQVQAGTNGFTCLLNRDGFFYNAAAFKPTCWDAEGATSYVPVMLRVGALLAAGKTPDDIRADIDAGFKDGRFHRPRRAGIAYMMAGDISLDPTTGKITRQEYPSHYMMYAPGVTSADLGWTREAAQTNSTLPFIFSAGAGGAELGYLIVAPQHR